MPTLMWRGRPKRAAEQLPVGPTARSRGRRLHTLRRRVRLTSLIESLPLSGSDLISGSPFRGALWRSRPAGPPASWSLSSPRLARRGLRLPDAVDVGLEHGLEAVSL